MKKLLFSSAALGAVLLAVALTGTRSSAAADAPDAKRLFTETHKCSMCHSVAAADVEARTKSEKLRGPDMSGFQTDMSFEKLAAFARKQAEIDGKPHKKEFKGTDEELQAILDWLGSLEAQE